MVWNGDTWTDASLKKFLLSHTEAGASISLLCAHVSDPRRFGRVIINEAGRITRFEEKAAGSPEAGWVSAGVYLLERPLLASLSPAGYSSLEHDVFEALPPGSLHGYQSEASFLDIGTPDSLREAEILLAAATGRTA